MQRNGGSSYPTRVGRAEEPAERNQGTECKAVSLRSLTRLIRTFHQTPKRRRTFLQASQAQHTGTASSKGRTGCRQASATFRANPDAASAIVPTQLMLSVHCITSCQNHLNCTLRVWVTVSSVLRVRSTAEASIVQDRNHALTLCISTFSGYSVVYPPFPDLCYTLLASYIRTQLKHHDC